VIPELRKFFEFDSGWDNPDTREVVEAMINCVEGMQWIADGYKGGPKIGAECQRKAKENLAALRAKLEAGNGQAKA